MKRCSRSWRGGLSIWGAVIGGASRRGDRHHLTGVKLPDARRSRWTACPCRHSCSPQGDRSLGQLLPIPGAVRRSRPRSPWGLEIDLARTHSGRRTRAAGTTTFQPTFLYESLAVNCLAIARLCASSGSNTAPASNWDRRSRSTSCSTRSPGSSSSNSMRIDPKLPQDRGRCASTWVHRSSSSCSASSPGSCGSARHEPERNGRPSRSEPDPGAADSNADRIAPEGSPPKV